MILCRRIVGLFIGLLYLLVQSVSADQIQVAVASNFTSAIKQIKQQFESKTGHEVILAFGSTGKHYAQIKNGAPFDLFLAADVRRPKLLEEEGNAIAGTRYTYALGRVVLWSARPGYVDDKGEVLKNREYTYLAITNPKLAPYGQAAKEVLLAMSLWEELRPIMVRGENVAQTFQFIKSGNAALGFVAYSQIKQPSAEMSGSYWEVPQSMYRPIEQQAVILKESEAARQFWNYLKGQDARRVIEAYGYGIP